MALKAEDVRDIDPIFWDVAVKCKGRCAYCGLDGSRDIRILRNFCLDHLIPRQAGGVHDGENRVLSCYYCNRDCKGNYDPNEGAAKPAERQVLLSKAINYVKNRQSSRYYDDLLDMLKQARN